MAWKQIVKTMDLMQSLSELGGKGTWQKQGGGKGGGKGSLGKNGAVKKQFCHWKGCKAAQNKSPTMGVKTECYSCGKHFNGHPPVQHLVGWAYDALLKEEEKKRTALDGKASGKDNDNKGTGAKGAKGAGKGGANAAQASAQPPQESAAAEEELRKKRLEEIRAVKAGDKTAAGNGTQAAVVAKEEPSIMEEVNTAWALHGAEADADLQIDPALAEKLENWDLRPLFDSMRHDQLPAQSTVKTAEAVVASILGESKPCAGAAAATKLAAELEALKKTLLHYDTEGLSDLKAEAEARIKASSEKLEKLKTPTAELQRKDVVAVKGQFIRDAQARTETAGTGKQKAAERIAARATLIQDTIRMYQELEGALAKRDAALEAAHAKKSAAIERRDGEVCALFDQKVEELAAKEAVARAKQTSTAALASTAAPQSQQPPPVDAALQKALLELETFKLEQKRLMQTIGDLQAAATIADATAAEAEAALAAPMDLGAAAPATPTPHPRTPAEAHALRIRYVKDDLVTLDRELSDKEKRVAGAIIANARTWIERALPPITYDQLLAGAAPAADAITLLEGMIGSVIWTKFYEGQPALTIQDFVPAQLASIIQAVALKLDKEVLEYSVTLKDKAAKTFDKAEAADMVHREKHTGAYRAY